jgi:hypothetical protein
MARKPHDAASESQTPTVINLHERLGQPAELAAFAAQQYHNRSFLGRHPIFTFVFMSLPIVVLSFIVATYFFFYIGSDLTGFLDSMNEAAHPLLSNLVMSLIVWSLTAFPRLMTMLLLCRIARRNAVRWRWVITACILGAIYCAQVRMDGHAKPSPTGKGVLSFGWGIYLDSWNWTVYYFLPKFAFVMAIGLLLIKRAQRLQKMDASSHGESSLRRAA